MYAEKAFKSIDFSLSNNPDHIWEFPLRDIAFWWKLAEAAGEDLEAAKKQIRKFVEEYFTKSVSTGDERDENWIYRCGQYFALGDIVGINFADLLKTLLPRMYRSIGDPERRGVPPLYLIHLVRLLEKEWIDDQKKTW